MKHGTRLLFAALTSALLATPAAAHDNGRYANADPNIKAWVNGLKSARSGKTGCCDESAGAAPEAVWGMGNGKYRVSIGAKIYGGPADAVITEPNRIGYAVVWFYWQSDTTTGVRTRM